jgi:hypothetical protein
MTLFLAINTKSKEFDMPTDPILTENQYNTNQDVLAAQGINTVQTPTGLSAINTTSIASTGGAAGQNPFGVDVPALPSNASMPGQTAAVFNIGQSGVDAAVRNATEGAVGTAAGAANPFNAGAGATSNPFGGNSSNANANPTQKKNVAANPSTEADRKSKADWRVRLTLAPGANYLYRGAAAEDILYPLKQTDGIIFPYTPTINIGYSANYDPIELTHNNFKIYQYRSSSVNEINISAEFTAQDTQEANYLIAVIHFFKTVTKMFYGQDQHPKAGTPPPLCYLSGFGAYQFDNHPLVISNFAYALPNDVDYIRAGTVDTGQRLQSYSKLKGPGPSGIQKAGQLISKIFRLKTAGLPEGARPNNADIAWETNKPVDPTYVPSKMTISLTCLPIVTRYDISQNFSVTEYAKGRTGYRGSLRSGGGIW